MASWLSILDGSWQMKGRKSEGNVADSLEDQSLPRCLALPDVLWRHAPLRLTTDPCRSGVGEDKNPRSELH